jgi:hypothetical protein
MKSHKSVFEKKVVPRKSVTRPAVSQDEDTRPLAEFLAAGKNVVVPPKHAGGSKSSDVSTMDRERSTSAPPPAIQNNRATDAAFGEKRGPPSSWNKPQSDMTARYGTISSRHEKFLF